MSKQKEEFEGLGYGPGVDPIPTPDNDSVSATGKLEEVVDALLNNSKEDQQDKNQRQKQADVSNRTADK
ncbi:hypothetical protein D3C73_1313950 [compost metagenome]